MKKILVLISLFIFSHIFSQNYILNWFDRINGITDINSKCLDINQTGDTYTAGYFNGGGPGVDFNPDQNTDFILHTDFGYQNVFYVQKLDQNGNFIWTKGFGSTSNSSVANDIKVRYENGNEYIYVLGHFVGSIDFDPGPNQHILSTVLNPIDNLHHDDIFILKLDANGNFIWVKQFGNNDYDIAYNMTFDSQGNLLFTGFFNASLYTRILDDPFQNYTDMANDMHIYKIAPSGQIIWDKMLSGSGNVGANAITTDSNDNVIIGGNFINTIDFNPGTDMFTITSFNNHSDDIFILKLDSNGNFIWAKHLPGSSIDTAISILCDNDNHIYLSGIYNYDIDLDPGTNVFSPPYASDTNSFFLKLDSSGSFVWAIVGHIGNLRYHNNKFYFTNGSTNTINLIDNNNNPVQINISNDDRIYTNVLSFDDINGFNLEASFSYPSYGGSVYVSDYGFYNNMINCTGIFTGEINFDTTGSNPYIQVAPYYGTGYWDVFTLQLTPNSSRIANKENDNFSVYPNPIINNKLFIKPKNNRAYSIILADISGKILQKSNNIIGDKTIMLNQVKGIYFLHIKQGNSEKISKIIVE